MLKQAKTHDALTEWKTGNELRISRVEDAYPKLHEMLMGAFEENWLDLETMRAG